MSDRKDAHTVETVLDIIKQPLTFTENINLASYAISKVKQGPRFPTERYHTYKSDRIQLAQVDVALELTSSPCVIEHGDFGPLSDVDSVRDFARREIMRPMQMAFQRLGRAFEVATPQPAEYSAAIHDPIDFVFRHRDARGDTLPYMLLGTVQPSIIDRARWQNWRTIPSYPVEDHLFYQAYLQAIAFSCPQICIFDGFTLISMNVYGITAQDVSAANCRAEADIVFDYLYDGRGPPTHEPLNTRNLNDDAIEGAGYRGTIREAVFDALMDGVRRVACTRLTPQGPHPIPVLDVLGFQKRVRRDIGTVYYYSARESAGQESASRESAPQPSLFRRALQHFFSGPPPADQEDTEATAPMDQSIILESVDLLSDGGNVRSDGTLRMVFMFHCLEPRCWAPLCDPF